ncbi:uncharacterized protein JCM15063_000522 [Sporobolomyces koalae]|uniref:uncharacterized protein n=1 Tax=Sporobolomyces koalae TaxID=500713 RepID=UPI003182987F
MSRSIAKWIALVLVVVRGHAQATPPLPASTLTLTAATSGDQLSVATGPLVRPEEAYLMQWHSSVYQTSVEFCQEWDESCLEYLHTFSDKYRIYCDAAAPGPDVRVFCGSNTVNRPNEFFDFTANNQRFVSASLVAGPGEDQPDELSTQSTISTQSTTNTQISSSFVAPITTDSLAGSASSIFSTTISTYSSSTQFVTSSMHNPPELSASSSSGSIAASSAPIRMGSTSLSLSSSANSKPSSLSSSTSSTSSTSSSPSSSTSSSFSSLVSTKTVASSTSTSTSLRPTITALPQPVVDAQEAADKARKEAEEWLRQHEEEVLAREREWELEKHDWLEKLADDRDQLVHDAQISRTDTLEDLMAQVGEKVKQVILERKQRRRHRLKRKH